MADNSRTNPTAHSEPIPINTRMGRGRSASVSSASSSSASSPSEIPTPISSANSSVRIAPASPGSSPILNYFFNQSPSKPPPGAQNTYPFRKFGPPPVFEEVEEGEPPVHAHARRASNATAGRFAQPQGAMPASDSTFERGTGILRRLSLSSSFAKPNDPARRSPPNAPPNSAVSPVESRQLPPFSREGGGKPRRSATISMDSKPRRAPSPMGERILKGHFDGFN